MTTASLMETLALGAITGMRSMAGPAALALRGDGVLKLVVPVLAIGEMLADKSSLIGDRTEALPLAGRAIMGALVGRAVAREARGSVLLGALLGAAAAVGAAQLACEARKRLPLPSAVGGVLEDAFVMHVAALYVQDESAAS